MIIKLSASSKEEFGKRLLMGAPHMNGNQMTNLNDLHDLASRTIQARKAGNLAQAAQWLGHTKNTAQYAKTSKRFGIKDIVGKIKDTMGSKTVKAFKSINLLA